MDYLWYFQAVLEGGVLLLLLGVFTSIGSDSEEFIKSMIGRFCAIMFFLVIPLPFMLLGIMWDFKYLVLSIMAAGVAWHLSKNRYSITIRKKEPTNA